MENLNKIKSELAQHYGTENYYRGLVKTSLYTDGMKALMDAAECYWLYDIIQTEVFDVLRKLSPDTYYFKITSADSEADITLVDYRGEVLYSRHIDFTTFPEGEMDLQVGYDGEYLITCLTSEN